MTTQTEVPTFDPMALSSMEDPYPLYEQWRAAGPLLRGATLPGTWGACCHADVSTLLKDKRLSRHFPMSYLEIVLGKGEATELNFNIMLNQDPPHHTRVRHLVSRAFGGLTIRKLRAAIAVVVDDLIERALAKDSFDLIDDFAYPMPLEVICDLLGIEVDDRDEVKRRAVLLGGDERHGAARWMRSYIGDAIAGRVPDADGDLIERMLAAEEGDDSLTHEEIVDNTVLLFLAGFATTTNLVANGCQALFDHPEQLALLRADPSLAPLAVEEFLRFDSPVPAVGRLALEPIEIGGREIGPGCWVVLLLGSANRDEAVFSHADRLDITRKPNPHVGFGAGIHHCLGAVLARLEGEIALGRLARLRVLEPAGEAERAKGSGDLRGFLHMPVRAA